MELLRRPWVALAILLLAAGCAADGTVGEPSPPRLSWLAYLSGADIREGCVGDRPDHLRLVRQDAASRRLQAFEIVADGFQGAFVEVHDFPGTDPRRIDLSAPAGPWAERSKLARLTVPQYRQFLERLAASGVLTEPPAQTVAPDEQVWLVSGCLAGTWFLAPYVAPHRRLVEVMRP
ncbi:MAG TPA: hypothetical protein VEB64_12630 [Azospirillaceae bacterium]|nr:hypothetical protein [Azospirillaceae bacterium]